MIVDPQIFIIFEPGMYGTFLCSLFTEHKLYKGSRSDRKYIGNEFIFNAHGSGYKDNLRQFHTHEDSVSLCQKNHTELLQFFQKLNGAGLGVHRLSSYYFTKIDFARYFKKFARIIVKPNAERLEAYTERHSQTTASTHMSQWWATENFAGKDLTKVPDWFIQEMEKKELRKYLQVHTDFLNHNFTIDTKHDIEFDPDGIIDQDSLKGMVDSVCSLLEIENFELPFKEILTFTEKNKKFLYRKP
jgi:hypothetical protein